jgi:hypothetical protein
MRLTLQPLCPADTRSCSRRNMLRRMSSSSLVPLCICNAICDASAVLWRENHGQHNNNPFNTHPTPLNASKETLPEETQNTSELNSISSLIMVFLCRNGGWTRVKLRIFIFT